MMDRGDSRKSSKQSLMRWISRCSTHPALPESDTGMINLHLYRADNTTCPIGKGVVKQASFKSNHN